MTRKDIIAMAREAGYMKTVHGGAEVSMASMDCLERFAALVAAAEREACAKECKFGRSSADIEQAIRARSNK